MSSGGADASTTATPIGPATLYAASITTFFAGERLILCAMGPNPKIGGAQMAAGMVCGSCGTDLRETAKFCDECGAPTAMAADTAKYKQVTVLFADVVRSTDIAATVDIERLREIMTEVVERAAGVVRRYGGTAEYNGDGVMALFGAPVALEDHAFRACLAALAIQDEANLMADDVRRRDGVSLQLRVGLNSGRVIVGEIGSGALGYAATGATVGFAAADGVRGASRRGVAFGIDRETGRGHGETRRTDMGARQRICRAGSRVPVGGDRPA